MPRPLLTALLLLSLTACQNHDIGAPCVPEQVPAGGFVAIDTYLETSSPQCETRLCLVRGLTGDPRPECQPGTCVSDEDARDHVYCTSHCGDEGSSCPTGFTCEDTGSLGGLCVRTP